MVYFSGQNCNQQLKAIVIYLYGDRLLNLHWSPWATWYKILCYIDQGGHSSKLRQYSFLAILNFPDERSTLQCPTQWELPHKHKISMKNLARDTLAYLSSPLTLIYNGLFFWTNPLLTAEGNNRISLLQQTTGLALTTLSDAAHFCVASPKEAKTSEIGLLPAVSPKISPM